MNEKGYEIIILKVRVLPIKLYNIIARQCTMYTQSTITQ